ncbi:hypothetical protein KA005_75515, partial [bacterium]|nr:hypothetical protein [bacterium]
MGIHAIHADQSSTTGKLSDTSIEVATTKRCMVETARRTILLANLNKFGAPAFCDVCDPDQLDAVVTDKGISFFYRRAR